MGTGATLYRVQLELSDIERSVYASLDLRIARHPSESLERVVVRVVARAIEHDDDLEFGRGLSTTDEPALWSRTPDGRVETWVDVGAPSADRLHAASKRSRRVVVVTDKADPVLAKAWSTRPIHAADRIEVVRLEPRFVQEFAGVLERSIECFLTVQDGLLTAAVGEHAITGAFERCPLSSVSQSR